jgi:histone H3/H4
MRRILSADGVYLDKIPKSSIKKMVKDGSNSDIIISDRAAEAIAKLLEDKAKRIAEYAVDRAKKKKRATITEEDINAYKLTFGD